MKNNFIRWIYFVLALLICALCILCCVLLRIEDDETPASPYVINGTSISFLSEDKLAELREPLVKLLANKEQPIDTDDLLGGFEFEAPDPESPSIVDGYGCGLLDVTGDGTPELLVFPVGFGGSSGAQTYYAYDILTGTKLTEISTGYGTLCNYYVKDANSFVLVNSHTIRCGTLYTDYYLSARFYGGSIDNATLEVDIMERHFGTDDFTYERSEAEKVEYYVNDVRVCWADYQTELERFGRNYIMIPETEFKTVSWNGIDDEDRFVWAEIIADALLSTGQRFIVP